MIIWYEILSGNTICWLHSVFINRPYLEVSSIFYTWLSDSLGELFETIEVLKESDRGTVKLIRHRATGKRFILRSFQGNGEVYRELLAYRSSRLPMIYEVASEGDRNLVLEEYIEGDNMGTLLKESLFTPKETRKIVRDLCLALWVLHSMGAVHRDVKPENVLTAGQPFRRRPPSARSVQAASIREGNLSRPAGTFPEKQYGWQRSCFWQP